MSLLNSAKEMERWDVYIKKNATHNNTVITAVFQAFFCSFYELTSFYTDMMVISGS